MDVLQPWAPWSDRARIDCRLCWAQVSTPSQQLDIEPICPWYPRMCKRHAKLRKIVSVSLKIFTLSLWIIWLRCVIFRIRNLRQKETSNFWRTSNSMDGENELGCRQNIAEQMTNFGLLTETADQCWAGMTASNAVCIASSQAKSTGSTACTDKRREFDTQNNYLSSDILPQCLR